MFYIVKDTKKVETAHPTVQFLHVFDKKTPHGAVRTALKCWSLVNLGN
jgi:hypothetical protein